MGTISAIGSFVIGESPIGGIRPPPLPFSPATWPFASALSALIPAYVYTQYADDDNIQAFNTAFNGQAQNYVDTFFQLQSIADYTQGWVSGPVLDYVAQGIYGIKRPVLPLPSTPEVGTLATYTPGAVPPLAGSIPGSAVSVYATSDDIYKRCLTWALYKGDGRQFTLPWLKRRVSRFLNGLNGTDPVLQDTFNVSVSITGNAVLIRVPVSVVATSFGLALAAGALEVPPFYTYTVEQVAGSAFGTFAFGLSPFGAVANQPINAQSGALILDGFSSTITSQ